MRRRCDPPKRDQNDYVPAQCPARARNAIGCQRNSRHAACSCRRHFGLGPGGKAEVLYLAVIVSGTTAMETADSGRRKSGAATWGSRESVGRRPAAIRNAQRPVRPQLLIVIRVAATSLAEAATLVGEREGGNLPAGATG